MHYSSTVHNHSEIPTYSINKGTDFSKIPTCKTGHKCHNSAVLYEF